MIEHIKTLKSTRLFTNKPVDNQTKRLILEEATLAPTAGNMMMYAMLDVVDQDLKDKLSVRCDNQPFIKTAPMVLVFCSDNLRFIDGAQHFYQAILRDP